MIFPMSNGMHRMNHFFTTMKKISQNFLYSEHFVKILIFLLLLLLTTPFMSYCVNAADSFYTPATPLGVSSGYLDVEYEYIVFTTNPSAKWMFDWGDGTYSTWLQLTNGSNTISQTHQWTSIGIYQVRAQFKDEFIKNGVWSEPLSVTINIAFSDDYPHTPRISSATVLGQINESYYYGAIGSDAQNDTLQYRFDWGNNILSDWTEAVPSGSHAVVSHQWNLSGNYSIRVQSRDQHWLPAPWSSPLNVSIRNDVENEIISQEVIMLNGMYHTIKNTRSNEKIFYNSTSGVTSYLQASSSGTYLLDDNADGRWDHVYTPSLGTLELYQPPPEKKSSFQIPWLIIIIISVIVSCVLLVVFLIKKGFIYVYEEEVAAEK